jgi:sulfopyruvate decarboxylase subunit beta
MLISYRGEFGERDPWQTEGGRATDPVLETLRIPYQRMDDPGRVVLDGDGSILMNLGALTTMARYRPRNLVHIVFDSESLVSVGGFPTATSTGSDITGIAAAGIPRTMAIGTIEQFAAAFNDALGAGELTTVVAKIEAAWPRAYLTDLPLLETRFQFQRHLRDIHR